MARKIRLIDANEQLKNYFGEVFNLTETRIMQAARHGVSNALNLIKDKTKSNISSSYFRSATSQHYPVGLIQGVKAYLYQGEPTGFVDILGNTRTNDGTWRLRFFEGGTKQRKSKNGRSYGALRGAYFFSNAYASIGSDAYATIQQAVNEAVDEINSKDI